MDANVGDSPGGSVEFEDGSMLEYEGVYKQRELGGISGGSEPIMLTIRLATDVGIGLLSAWLYDKLKGHEAMISTPRGTINIEGLDKEELQKALEVLLTQEDEG